MKSLLLTAAIAALLVGALALTPQPIEARSPGCSFWCNQLLLAEINHCHMQAVVESWSSSRLVGCVAEAYRDHEQCISSSCQSLSRELEPEMKCIADCVESGGSLGNCYRECRSERG